MFQRFGRIYCLYLQRDWTGLGGCWNYTGKNCLFCRTIRDSWTNDSRAGRRGSGFPKPVKIAISRRVLEEYHECIMRTTDSMWDNRSSEGNIRSTGPEIPPPLTEATCPISCSQWVVTRFSLRHPDAMHNLNSCLRNIKLVTITLFTPKSYVSLLVTFPAKLLHVSLVYPMRATCLLCISLS
jgi:hypothetical protein